ncbi:MAG: cyclopropane-fatty-acyl-phospholipid synthase family protein [Acidimicrobiia bacterium]|nr:cyclopropane-fatty-acyl-phospholipid synthase family protein [Acidimicrobiia bacterium]
MRSAADEVRTIVEAFLGDDPPLRVTCWDGSAFGDPDAAVGITISSPRALRRLVWNPDELGLARAYVAGELEVHGSVFDLLALRDQIGGRDADVALHLSRREWLSLLGSARRLGAIGLRPARPPEEARLRGRLHSRARDAAAIGHHYDVGNDFYRLVLGPTMTYSCAYFPEQGTSLDEAQHLKYELICRKLGLCSGMRLLDVGCGWGGMVIHAAERHGVEAVGITISREQAELARQRVRDAGLDGRVEIRLQDYRDIDDGPYDAISSIGMFEHVGIEQLTAYLRALGSLLQPGGRLLNHAISRPCGKGDFDHDSFVARYVFPDGHLHEVGRVVSALQDEGLECRDVESLREHYARTLRHWIANLEANWDDAVALAGGPRSRIWLLYMAGSAIGFEANRLNIHQVLATRSTTDGASHMPPTRAGFLTPGTAPDAHRLPLEAPADAGS